MWLLQPTTVPSLRPWDSDVELRSRTWDSPAALLQGAAAVLFPGATRTPSPSVPGSKYSRPVHTQYYYPDQTLMKPGEEYFFMSAAMTEKNPY